LEYNKLLLKLNPLDDPVGALLIIDANALEAEEIKFIQSFPVNFCKEIY